MTTETSDDCPHCGQPYLKRHCPSKICGWKVCKACQAVTDARSGLHRHPEDRHGQCSGPASLGE